jgi:hypothetical protein
MDTERGVDSKCDKLISPDYLSQSSLQGRKHYHLLTVSDKENRVDQTGVHRSAQMAPDGAKRSPDDNTKTPKERGNSK